MQVPRRCISPVGMHHPEAIHPGSARAPQQAVQPPPAFSQQASTWRRSTKPALPTAHSCFRLPHTYLQVAHQCPPEHHSKTTTLSKLPLPCEAPYNKHTPVRPSLEVGVWIAAINALWADVQVSQHNHPPSLVQKTLHSHLQSLQGRWRCVYVNYVQSIQASAFD